jgi:ubiquitin-protein ligase
MLKRIKTEYEKIMKNPLEGVDVKIDENNDYLWHVFIKGPKDSPYEGGTFKINIIIPENYPFTVILKIYIKITYTFYFK